MKKFSNNSVFIEDFYFGQRLREIKFVDPFNSIKSSDWNSTDTSIKATHLEASKINFEDATAKPIFKENNLAERLVAKLN